jgi:hypothetical protein
MRVVPLRNLKDNYAYLVFDSLKRGFLVDPVEIDKIKPVIEKEGVHIEAILTTVFISIAKY